MWFVVHVRLACGCGFVGPRDVCGFVLGSSSTVGSCRRRPEETRSWRWVAWQHRAEQVLQTHEH